MTRPLSVGIIGCGIAGTATALLLARQRHAVTLFEQSPQVGPVGAGVLLQPSGQSVLDRMGLMQPLLPKVEQIEQIHALTERGHDLVRLRYGDLRPDLHGVGLHRGDLFSLLHSRLEAEGVELLLGTQIVDVRSTDRPTILDAGRRAYGPFDLLVVADGSRSRLRDACGLPAHVFEYEYGALWMVADVAPVRGQLLQAARGTVELAGLLPVGRQRCSFFWGVRRSQFETLRHAGFARFRERVLRLLPQAEPLLDCLGCLEAGRFVTYRHVHQRRSWRGRIVFIGDAAHAMSPHLGQGVNLALQDAEALATAVAVERSIPSALRRFERSRRWSVRYYAAVTALLTPFFQSPGSVLGWGRNVTLPLMCQFPPTRRLMLQTLSGRA